MSIAVSDRQPENERLGSIILLDIYHCKHDKLAHDNRLRDHSPEPTASTNAKTPGLDSISGREEVKPPISLGELPRNSQDSLRPQAEDPANRGIRK